MSIFGGRASLPCRLFAASLAGIVPMVIASGDASAAQCAPRKISATGANSGMTVFAKSRAKAAWIKKVSSDPRLGPNYAQWLRAADRRTLCRKVDNRVVCMAVALPCLSPRVVIVAPGNTRSAAAPNIRPVKPARSL